MKKIIDREVTLRKTMTPNFVLTEEGESIPIGQLTQEELYWLIDEFKKEVQEKWNKANAIK